MRREDEGEQADAGLLLFQGGKEGGGDDATGDGEAHEGTDPTHHFNLELIISSISMKYALKDLRKVLDVKVVAFNLKMLQFNKNL